MLLASILLLPGLAAIAAAQEIPEYIKTYAPLVYLDENEVYLPSDIGAQVKNTFPALNFTRETDAPSPLTLDNLDDLNASANCTLEEVNDCPVFLTSQDDPSTDPEWFAGVLPDLRTGETKGAVSSVIIVNDHGGGLVDAFYMYFYAFNYGGEILNSTQGNHVGDWEHNMIRFQDGEPVSIWYSQHDSGQALTYRAVQKSNSRPLVFSSLGGHANYAVRGTHSRPIETPAGNITLNDTTSEGPLWDPTLSAYYYTYSLPNATSDLPTFVPSTPDSPTSFLYFLGRWGDKQLPDSDPRQTNLLDLNLTWTWVNGPTGPIGKNLNRTEICNGGSQGNVNTTECVTTTELPASSGSTLPVTVSRTRTETGGMGTSSPTDTGSTGSGAAIATATATTTGTSGAGAILPRSGGIWIGTGLALLVTALAEK